VSTEEIERLRGLALFAALSDDALALLCAHRVERRCQPGETVFVEGDASHMMYVILEGEIEIVKRTTTSEVRVALLGQGECFGEVGLLAVSRRVATARSLRESHLFELPARSLRELYQHDTKSYALLTMNLARGLARKLQVAETLLARAVS
jgi:CRP-like cAMP-binding protein